MDLRQYNLTDRQKQTAVGVLNYQPFIISDDVRTGVAYSWLHSPDPRVRPPLVFHRSEYALEWTRIVDCNDRLAAMYDQFLDEIANRFPQGSLLDVACNNGYFPVGAELRGLRGTGIDLTDYSSSVRFLNSVLNTKVKFVNAGYDPERHALPIRERFDVVVASAIMCHLPDPLNFLAALGQLAKHAIFFWGQMVDTDHFLISYNPPVKELSTFVNFPSCFNDNTRLSRGLFFESLRLMGFTEIAEITPRDSWLDLPCTIGSLDTELAGGSKHVAVLAMR